MTEQKVPQPPQLQKKPKPIFGPDNSEAGAGEGQIPAKPAGDEIPKTELTEPATKPKEENKPADGPNKSYDELFGNGIV